MAFLLSAAAFSADLFHNNLFPVNMHIFLSNEHAGLLQPFTLLREAFLPKNKLPEDIPAM